MCEDLEAKIKQCSNALVDAEAALTNATLAAELDPAAGDEVVRARERVELFRTRRRELEAALTEAEVRSVQQAKDKAEAERRRLIEVAQIKLKIRGNLDAIIDNDLEQLASSVAEWRAAGEDAIRTIRELNDGQNLAFSGLTYDNDAASLRLAVFGASPFLAKMLELEPYFLPDNRNLTRLRTQQGRCPAHGWLFAQASKMAPGDEPGPAAEAPLPSDPSPSTASEPEPAEAGGAQGALTGV